MGRFSVLGSEQGGEGGAASGESCLDRSLWTVLDPCDLAEGKVAEMVEHDRPPLYLRQLLERRDKGCGGLRRGCCGLRLSRSGEEPYR